jgi:hypothetical protein
MLNMLLNFGAKVVETDHLCELSKIGENDFGWFSLLLTVFAVE